MLNLYYQNDTQSLVKQEDAFKILRSMTQVEYNCYYCITNRTNHAIIGQILQIHDNGIEQQLKVSHVRLVLNLFGIFNIVLVFIVYGGPAIFNFLTCINGLCILIVPFVKHFHYMIYMESSVVFVSTVVTMQSLYCIIIAVLEIDTKLSIKTE